MSGSQFFFPKKGFQTQEYFNPGSYNFTVPPGVRNMLVTVVGGGGAGGAGQAGAGNGASGGQGGGVTQSYVNVTPGEVLNIVVGAGGVSPSWPIAPPAGNPSYFQSANNYIYVEGGSPGVIGNNGSYVPPANALGGRGIVQGGDGGAGGDGLVAGEDGGHTPYALGGVGSPVFGSQGGTGGGGASFGPGGRAGNFALDGGTAVAGQRGGGGGGGQNGGAGGNGGNGLVILTWVQSI